MEGELIFVYNADGGLFGMVTDFAHKLLSPASYACRLCALTYGHFSRKQEWKLFLEALPVKSVFYHKDEWLKQHAAVKALPAVFFNGGGQTEEIITQQEINRCLSLDALMALVTQKLESYVKHHHSNL